MERLEKLVVGYLRVSTNEQVSNGFGLDVQKQTILKYSRQHKLGRITFYEEKGVSGALENRPALGDLLAAAEEGEVGKVIIVRLDRLARDLILQETLLKNFKKLGVELISVSEPDLLRNDPSRKMVRQIMGAVNEYEKAMIKLRLHGGKISKAKQGGFAGGQRPLGYIKTVGFNGRRVSDLIKDPEEARTVELIFKLKEGREKMSLHQIARELDEKGLRTKRGGKWYAGTVRYILQNSIYKGLMSYEGTEKKRKDLIITGA